MTKFHFPPLILSLLFTLLVLPKISFADGPDAKDFSHKAEIKQSLQANTLYRVHLTPEVIHKLTPSLGDMRVFDQKGKEIPYVMLDHRAKTNPAKSYTLNITGFSEKTNGVELIATPPKKYETVSLLSLMVPDRNFKKHVTVEGKDPSGNWIPLASDYIYDFSAQVDVRQTTIPIKQSIASKYRILISDVSNEKRTVGVFWGPFLLAEKDVVKRLKITSITISSKPSTRVRSEYDAVAISSFEQKEDDGTSMITFESGYPAEKVALSIATPFYQRRVTLFSSFNKDFASKSRLTAKTIYKFPLDGKPQTDSIIPISPTKTPYLQLVAENRDNPPLEIQKITLSWTRKQLFLVPRQDSTGCSLYFGNTSINKPSYDLASFITQANWHSTPFVDVSLNPIEENSAYKPKKSAFIQEYMEKYLLIGIIVLLALGMMIWLIRLFPKNPSQEEQK